MAGSSARPLGNGDGLQILLLLPGVRAACPAIQAVALVSYRGLDDGPKREIPSFAEFLARNSAGISS